MIYARPGGTQRTSSAWTDAVWFQDDCPLGRILFLRDRVVLRNLLGKEGRIGTVQQHDPHIEPIDHSRAASLPPSFLPHPSAA